VRVALTTTLLPGILLPGAANLMQLFAQLPGGPMWSKIVPGVVLLGIVIFFHELGHFLVAKWRGITVTKFSLGMGPEMLGFTAGGTRYCLSWIPLGGFVQMAGDHPNEDGSIPEGGPEQFLTHPWYGRLLVAVAGPAANLVFAFVTYFVLYSFVGVGTPDFPNVLGPVEAGSPPAAAGLAEGDVIHSFAGTPVATWWELESAISKADTTKGTEMRFERGDSSFAVALPAGSIAPFVRALDPPSDPPVVGNISSGSPAYLAGLKEGDRILTVDGTPIARFGDVSPLLRGKAGRDVTLHVRRGEEAFDVTVRPMKDPEGDPQRALIGIRSAHAMKHVERFPVVQSVKSAGAQTLFVTGRVCQGLYVTFTRFMEVREQMGGPIFIAQMASEAARQGLDWWLDLMGTISLAVMAFNLLPIPLLDGGHILLALLEAVRRRALSARGYLRFMRVGLIFVGTLFVFIIAQDVMRPLRRMKVLEKAPRETTTVAPAPR
jgi:regulator of sigma E protease